MSMAQSYALVTYLRQGQLVKHLYSAGMRLLLPSRPCVRSVTHQPVLSTYSPGVMVGAVPTTVTRSRWPRTLTRSTQKQVSSLWNVTRSTLPARYSVGVSDAGEGVSSDMVASLDRGALHAWQKASLMIISKV